MEPEEITKAEMDAIEAAAMAGKPLSRRPSMYVIIYMTYVNRGAGVSYVPQQIVGPYVSYKEAMLNVDPDVTWGYFILGVQDSVTESLTELNV